MPEHSLEGALWNTEEAWGSRQKTGKTARQYAKGTGALGKDTGGDCGRTAHNHAAHSTA